MKIRSLIVTAIAAAILPTGFAVPAQAAGLQFTFNASPEPVRKCGKLLLAGEMYEPSVSNYTGHYVNFYFKKTGTTRYVYKSYDQAANNGRYSRYLTQCYSGTWKAVVKVGDYSSAGKADYVAVR